MSEELESEGVAVVAQPGKAVRKGGFQKGHDPRRNVTRPGTGRPPNAFRDALRKLIESPKVKAAVKKILEDPTHPQFAQLYGKLVAQAHGNPAQPVTGGDGEGPVAVDVHVTHEVVDPVAR